MHLPAPSPSQLNDPAWCEVEYNPRVTVAEAADMLAGFPAQGAAARQRLTGRYGLSYGQHPREIVDYFPAERPIGSLIYIHGGYWRAGAPDWYSWIAEAPVAQGISTVLIGYPLCPEVNVGQIARSCQSALAYTVKSLLTPLERSNMVVAGHSAGGYLAASMVTADWNDHGLSPLRLSGVVPISGVFELAPLVRTTMNDDIRLSIEEARLWSLQDKAPRVVAPVIPVVGALESREFHRQSALLSQHWPSIAREPVSIAGAHHVSVAKGFCDPSSTLFGVVKSLLGQT